MKVTRRTRGARTRAGRLLGAVLAGGMLAPTIVGCAANPPPRLAPLIPADQLDLSGYAAKPCDLLRTDRVSRRHLNPDGATIRETDETACRWSAVDTTHVSIAAGADMSHNLEWVYQHRAEFGTFQPAEVSNYPAADTTATGELTSTGSTCTTRVGIADDSLLTVSATSAARPSRFAEGPCVEAEKFAFAIITQMLGSS